MARERREDILKAIPSVDSILSDPSIASLRRRHPQFPWTRFLRRVVDDYRASCLEGKSAEISDRETLKKRITGEVISRLDYLKDGGQRRVINGTGVILHTNLGRAVLAPRVRKAVSEALARYVNLEFDLSSGERSFRGEVMLELAALACGAEAAMVVNNNAGAVYLVVNSYSPPGRVIVSRGELIEIGGSFRLPDILSRSAGEVIEVGTTNRTYASDYERVARAEDVLLKVHQSNYDIQGFAHEASVAELVEVARAKSCYVVYDLGSGALWDFAAVGIQGEEVVSRVLERGVDCVTMSGDKLLGGVQAGIIVGRANFLARLRQNPLRRALRVDKLTIAALEELLRCYLFEEKPEDEVATLGLILAPMEGLKARANRILENLKRDVAGRFVLEVVDDEAVIGGGSFACQTVASAAISFRCASEKDAVALARRMRNHRIPLVPRLKGSEVRFNLRSVLPDEDEELVQNLAEIIGERKQKR